MLCKLIWENHQQSTQWTPQRLTRHIHNSATIYTNIHNTHTCISALSSIKRIVWVVSYTHHTTCIHAQRDTHTHTHTHTHAHTHTHTHTHVYHQLYSMYTVLTNKHWTPRGSSSSLSKLATHPATLPHSSGSTCSSATVVSVAILPMLELRGPFFGGRLV